MGRSNREDQIGGGSECDVFGTSDPNIIYKQYYNGIMNAVRAFQQAKKAEKAGIGPKAYTVFAGGYFTEKVNVVCGWTKGNWHQHPNYTALIDQTMTLKDKCKDSLGCVPYDLRDVNLGEKNGELIMIDFGDITFSGV